MQARVLMPDWDNGGAAMTGTRKYFGTDGIRGEVGRHPITVDFVLKLGWAAGTVLAGGGRGKVIIGKDTRFPGHAIRATPARPAECARPRGRPRSPDRAAPWVRAGGKGPRDRHPALRLRVLGPCGWSAWG